MTITAMGAVGWMVRGKNSRMWPWEENLEIATFSLLDAQEKGLQVFGLYRIWGTVVLKPVMILYEKLKKKFYRHRDSVLFLIKHLLDLNVHRRYSNNTFDWVTWAIRYEPAWSLKSHSLKADSKQPKNTASVMCTQGLAKRWCVIHARKN